MSRSVTVRHQSWLSVAVASLALLPCYSVRAQTSTEINTAQTTPFATSSAGDITIDSGYGITVSGVTAATIDSSNSVTNNGGITVYDAKYASGILTTGGTTGTITNNGTITNTDSTLATAIPLTPAGNTRYGIGITGAAAFNGSITNSSTGSIVVRGTNGSAGIYVGGGGLGLGGSISNAGTIDVTGDNSFGILTAAGATITGGISITNSIVGLGVGSGGLQLNGAVNGQVYIDSVVRGDGYFSNGVVVTARPTSFTGLGGNDYLQGGPAVSINNNVGGVGSTNGGGVYVDTSGDVVSYGTAAALQIAPAAGGSAELAVGGGSYGLGIAGFVEAYGLYDGFGATALQVGGGGGTAIIDTGIGVTGTVRATSYAANATGISILSGASVPSIVNSGTISATVNYGAGTNAATGGTATAVYVNGGALGTITNTGTISAATASGSANALDLQLDTVPVTVNQAGGTITGNILFGSSGATLNLSSGILTGGVLFGNSAGNSLKITGGAEFAGPLTETAGGKLALSILNGRLQSTSTSNVVLSSLTIGSAGEIDFSTNPVIAQSGSLTVSGVGAVIISTGAKVGLDIASKLTVPESFVVVQTTGSAGALVGQPTLQLGETPFFYVTNIVTDTTAGSITLNVRDRTFAEAGVAGSASAYNAVFGSSYNDTGIRDAFNGAGTQQAFKRLYQQMLPSYAGGLFEALSQGSNAIVRAQSGNPVVENGTHGGGWAQQFGFGEQNSTSGNAPGYHGGGIGFAFGWEAPASPISTWGVSVSYMRAAISDYDTGPKNQEVGTVYSAGLYWREVDGAFRTDASVNAGVAEMNSERNFAGTDLVGNSVSRTADAAWTGGIAQAHLGVSYEQPIGDFYVKPLLTGDYFVMYEGSRSEHNGGTGFNLNVASDAGKQGSVVGGVAFGTKFGDNSFLWRPEVMVGYKQVFGGADDVTAQFAGGSSFGLSPNAQQGGAIAHVGIHGGNKYSDFAFEAGGEDRGEYHNFDGRIVARFRF